jgi:hypothetical protein
MLQILLMPRCMKLHPTSIQYLSQNKQIVSYTIPAFVTSTLYRLILSLPKP